MRLWTVEKYEAESAIITPSLEARYPLLAGMADGPAGTSPSTRRGLELSRKGIQVTAYGPNSDGPGTVLRLWELAGKSGPLKVRLPDGMDAKQAQPVDLRGRTIAKPIAVKNGSFEVQAGAFAPVSIVLKAVALP